MKSSAPKKWAVLVAALVIVDAQNACPKCPASHPYPLTGDMDCARGGVNGCGATRDVSTCLCSPGDYCGTCNRGCADPRKPSACDNLQCVPCGWTPPPPSPQPSYDCDVTPTSKTCHQKPPGQGAFPTLAACEKNPMCAPSTATYACKVSSKSAQCVKGTGPFATLNACEKACQPPAPAPLAERAEAA